MKIPNFATRKLTKNLGILKSRRTEKSNLKYMNGDME